ncbi:Hypothetical predicted protein [Lecanosticta acicola]|uniref:Uncharacterized protein n=1 Tax=Lecanosticta acicola TaxID=111012 RepID=A0AAI9EDD2_9PEZI|nr:Hypothetical predicted protein [Lecanosticta acicola]
MEDRRLTTQDFDANRGKREVQLPCGHNIALQKPDGARLASKGCLDMTCPVRSEEIRQKSDRDEARSFEQDAELFDAVPMADGWAELGWDDLSDAIVTFDILALKRALRGAAEHLKARALVAP